MIHASVRQPSGGFVDYESSESQQQPRRNQAKKFPLPFEEVVPGVKPSLMIKPNTPLYMWIPEYMTDNEIIAYINAIRKFGNPVYMQTHLMDPRGISDQHLPKRADGSVVGNSNGKPDMPPMFCRVRFRSHPRLTSALLAIDDMFHEKELNRDNAAIRIAKIQQTFLLHRNPIIVGYRETRDKQVQDATNRNSVQVLLLGQYLSTAVYQNRRKDYWSRQSNMRHNVFELEAILREARMPHNMVDVTQDRGFTQKKPISSLSNISSLPSGFTRYQQQKQQQQQQQQQPVYNINASIPSTRANSRIQRTTNNISREKQELQNNIFNQKNRELQQREAELKRREQELQAQQQRMQQTVYPVYNTVPLLPNNAPLSSQDIQRNNQLLNQQYMQRNQQAQLVRQQQELERLRQQERLRQHTGQNTYPYINTVPAHRTQYPTAFPYSSTQTQDSFYTARPY